MQFPLSSFINPGSQTHPSMQPMLLAQTGFGCLQVGGHIEAQLLYFELGPQVTEEEIKNIRS